jgi:hypothetical protein
MWCKWLNFKNRITSLPRHLQDLTVYTRNTTSVLEEAGIVYSSPAPEFNPAFVLLIFWVFLVLSYYLPLRSELWCPFRFPHINDVWFRLYLQLFVGGLNVLFTYLCLFAHSGLHHILCSVFALFFFVLCNLCCQFLWIVHVLLILRYSLTFIYPSTLISNIKLNRSTIYDSKLVNWRWQVFRYSVNSQLRCILTQTMYNKRIVLPISNHTPGQYKHSWK